MLARPNLWIYFVPFMTFICVASIYRALLDLLFFFCALYEYFSSLLLNAASRISIVAMTGASIAIDDASATDTILSVKERVFALNRQYRVHRQRLIYRPGPQGMHALADDETLGGTCVARDGTAELDVLLADLTAAESAELCEKVLLDLAPYRPFSSKL
jgi:hypothetical protein